MYQDNDQFQFKKHTPLYFRCGEYTLDLARPIVMGIINTAPDSFCPNNRTDDPNEALAIAKQMIKDGAAIIDVGGEPTNPQLNDFRVNSELEINRVIPVIKLIKKELNVPISIDTSDPLVMQAAISAGAVIINDVRALRKPGALEMAISLDVPVCLMHMTNIEETEKGLPLEGNGISQIKQFLMNRKNQCIEAGIKPEHIILDPGFGGGFFGKSVNQNLAIIKHLDEFNDLNSPILLGVSRKSAIGFVLDAPVNSRLYGSIALTVLAANGKGRIIRTHDVLATAQAITMAVSVFEEI